MLDKSSKITYDWILDKHFIRNTLFSLKCNYTTCQSRCSRSCYNWNGWTREDDFAYEFDPVDIIIVTRDIIPCSSSVQIHENTPLNVIGIVRVTYNQCRLIVILNVYIKVTIKWHTKISVFRSRFDYNLHK